MKQRMAELHTSYYELQPGDATRYMFHITWPEPIFSGNCYFVDTDTGQAGETDPARLIDAEDEHVLISIHMPYWQGIYPTSKAALRHLIPEHVAYMAGHMGAKPKTGPFYTVCAVLLACSVLVDSPTELHRACEEMLRAKELLREIYG